MIQLRELTDEEIQSIASAKDCWIPEHPQSKRLIFDEHRFARAIIAAAREKA